MHLRHPVVCSGVLQSVSASLRALLRCVAVCCGVLRCVAVCSGVLQCESALLRALLQPVLRCVAGCCSVLQCVSASLRAGRHSCALQGGQNA